jgi:hypothetical protein
MSWQDFPYFKPSTPLAATGGIKAQSKQGGFAKNWWAKRWIAVLEGFHLGARLTRGRSYARRGQVLDIQVEHGIITAKVQGSRPRPYAVEIKIKPLSKAEQASLGKALAEQALFTAKLLGGEMPQDIEQAFAGAGLSLLAVNLVLDFNFVAGIFHAADVIDRARQFPCMGAYLRRFPQAQRADRPRHTRVIVIHNTFDKRAPSCSGNQGENSSAVCSATTK